MYVFIKDFRKQYPETGPGTEAAGRISSVGNIQATTIRILIWIDLANAVFPLLLIRPSLEFGTDQRPITNIDQ
jgi:hypothetical protein